MIVLDMMDLAQWHMITSITASEEFEIGSVDGPC